MRWTLLVTLTVLAAGVSAVAADRPKVRPLPRPLPVVERKGETVVKETWDWAAEMIPVARKFTGTQGFVVCMGDSMTYANTSTSWARKAGINRAGGYTDSDKAILRWSHAYDGKKPTNGWHLSIQDYPKKDSKHSRTACSGIQLNQYIEGGFRGMEPPATILKKYNPQVAFILLGGRDATRRSPDAVVRDMNTLIETVLNNGTIPVLMTLPPANPASRHKAVRAVNARFLGLAAARKVPIIDLYGEMVSRQPKGAWDGTLMKPGEQKPSETRSKGPATKENLKLHGQLLRCWLSVQKLKEVKAKVIDKARADPATKPAQDSREKMAEDFKKKALLKIRRGLRMGRPPGQ